jgi:uncharacterized protein (TIRG00374 family)
VTIGGFMVTALLCFIAVRDVRLTEVFDGLRRTKLTWLGPTLVVFGISILLRALRWRVLFEPARRPPMGATTRALLVGYLFNNLLPARTGEIARIIQLRNEASVPATEAATTVVLERILDVVSLVALLFAALPWLPRLTWITGAAVLGGIVTGSLVLIAVALALFGERPIRVLLRPLTFISAQRAELAVRHVERGLVALREPSVGIVALALTIASWLVMGASFWLLMQGFGYGGLGPGAALLVLVTVNMAMVLPSAPAALGVFEGSTVVALHAYGAPGAAALSYALVLHAVNFFPFIAVGGWVLFRYGIGLPGGRRRSVHLTVSAQPQVLPSKGAR